MLNKMATFFRESYWARFLLPVGLILMIFSIFVFIAVNNTKDFIKTEAEVSKIELFEPAFMETDGTLHEATYTIYVKYVVNEINYESEFGIFLEGYNIGDKVTICYNANNPNEISQPNSVLLPIILLTAGIGTFICGIISIIIAVKKHKILKEQEKEWTNGN